MALDEQTALRNLNSLIGAMRSLAVSVDSALEDNKIGLGEAFPLFMQTTMLAQAIYSSFVINDHDDRKVFMEVLMRVHFTMEPPA